MDRGHGRRQGGRAAVQGLILALALAAPAHAITGTDTRGAAPVAEHLGEDAAAVDAGDVDGDGHHDLLTGLNDAYDYSRSCATQNRADLVLGSPAPFALRPPDAGVVSFTCAGTPALQDKGPPGSQVSYGTSVGGSVAAVGDVNGDGLADIAIGAVGAGPRGRPDAGSVYIVLGHAGMADTDLRALGSAGIRIDGPERDSELGRTVVPVGDVNGDGHPDVALTYTRGAAAPDGRRLKHPYAEAAVVYGGLPGGTRVDLAQPGADALVLTGFARDTGSLTVAAGGDLNGDGLEDLLLGGAAARGVTAVAGRAAAGTARIAVDPLLRVTGPELPELGAGLTLTGDRNGDGVPEIAIAAVEPQGSISFPPVMGSITLIPARPGRVDLADPPADTLQITASEGSFGSSLTDVGDLTGDGVDDLAAAAPRASPGCRAYAGVAWLLPGSAATGTLDVDDVPDARRIDGGVVDGGLGGHIGVADLNLDGSRDLLLSGLPRPSAAETNLFALRSVDTQPRPSLATPGCLKVHTSLRGLRRTGRLHLRVRSSLGADEPHRVHAQVQLVAVPKGPLTDAAKEKLFERLVRSHPAGATLHLPGPGHGRVTVELDRPVPRRAYLELEVDQHLGRRGLVNYGFSVTREFRLGGAPELIR